MTKIPIINAFFVLMLSILMFPGQGDAYQTQWQSGSDLVGAITSVVVVKGDTVHKIAQRHDVGYSALLAANPGIDAYHVKAQRHRH
jgi:hypothetical protein